MGYISSVDRSNAGLVGILRCSAYKNSKDFFNVDQSWVKWTEEDENACVLVAWTNFGEAAATQRGRLFWTREEAELAEDCSFAKCRVEWPCIMLERSATHKDYRRLGLNSALRYHLLRLSMSWGIRQALAVVIADASRTRIMSDIGYEFYPGNRDWTVYGVPSDSHIQAAVLDLENKGEAALAHLSNKVCGDTLREYPWHGELPPVPKSYRVTH